MCFRNENEMKRNILLLVLVAITNSPAQTTPKDGFMFDGYHLGLSIRQLYTNNFLIADIPFIEARIPLVSDIIKLKYGGHLMWGVTKFYVEWSYATGIHIYPFGEYFSVNISGQIGTFFLDNFTFIGSIGTNFNFPLNGKKHISIGVEYFYRNSRDLFNYVSFPVYGDNNEESINIDSPGIGISIGLQL